MFSMAVTDKLDELTLLRLRNDPFRLVRRG